MENCLPNVGSRSFQNARLQKQFKKEAEAAFPVAVAAYRQGRHVETQALCRKILDGLPDHFDALHLLGVCELDCGRSKEAEEVLARAIGVAPRSAEAHANLGLALFNLRRYQEARKHQERAVALNPNFATAMTSLGNTLLHLGLLEQSIAAHDRAIALKPDYSDAYCNRGMAELMLARNEAANQNFDRALSFNSRHMQATMGKGMVALNLRHFEQALAAFNAALAINPRAAGVLAQRGRMRVLLTQYAEAEADFDAALAIDPTVETAWRGKGQVALHSANVALTLACANRVLERNPACEIAMTMLGVCCARQGDIAAAIEHFDRALAIKPDHEDAISKKIFVLDFAIDADFALHQTVRRSWWDRIGAKLPRCELPRRRSDPNKRIVVGYVSSDFRDHSAALAIKPVLRNHDHANFEIICYSCSPVDDGVTEECRSLADTWVDAWQFSDDELADRIQADNIDVLVDLSGHTAGNRLMVFARKPAPVQVTAFGSATGTGIPTIDAVLGDRINIPREVRHLFAERTICDLPCVIMMEPIRNQRPSPLPAIRNGHLTFGVFNRIDKISDHTLAVWSKLLAAIPQSTITIKHGGLNDPFLRDGLIGRFVASGVSAERITCIGSTPRQEHLAAFSDIDISLDPFPQNGGISTWESLYMGVPVIARLGNSITSRLAAAILTSIGLEDWVAKDDDGYIAIARRFASMLSDLQTLRASLPERIAKSPAGNAEIYTRRVEEIYRQLWRKYCALDDADRA
jgi:predicted O-linked N-acetylglucosamine transferase (SPINDLY family)